MNPFDLGPSLHGLLSPLHWYHAPTQIYPKPSFFKFWQLVSPTVPEHPHCSGFAFQWIPSYTFRCYYLCI